MSPPVIGRKVSHYQIEELLGRGGMGQVFQARDVALGRAVAIKLLPASFDAELRRRLLREAEAARRLQHPGIATFFEAGEAAGEAFIAMELVRGQTLRRRLAGGALPTAEALGIAAGLLEALGHAHAAGIVHRDIKPENVMITHEGTPKLLDFGLARHTLPGSASTTVASHTLVTGPGAILGTIGYMAPEQLRGEPVDARADLFALGAVLYEMLSGTPPFAGDTPAAAFAATLFTDPAPPPSLPAGVWPLVQRALARDREQRYGSAAEFLRDLRRVDAGQAIDGLPDTLAVLDFENRSGDPADAWIGSGFSDSLASDLGRFTSLRIVPRPKVLQVLGSRPQAGPAEIGHALGCRWVLGGAYQRVGPALRVVMHITHAPTERQTASEKLDGAVEEMFALQDRLAERAGEALRVAVEPAHAARPRVLGAYESVVRGRQEWLRMSKGAFDQAQELFESAEREQPGYADALAGLAAVHDMRFTYTTDPAELARAEAHARRALEAQPGHVDAHVWLAYALWRQGRTEEAIGLASRARELQPSNHYPWYFEGCMRMSLGQGEGAIPLLQRAVELGPTFGFAWVALGNAHLAVGNGTEAEWILGRGVELESRGVHATAGADGYVGECLRRQGRLEEARKRCLAGLEAVERSDHMYRDTLRSVCLCTLGRTALDQGAREAASASFHQCELHLGGRPRTLGGGFLLCQALAGRSAAEGDPAVWERADGIFRARDRGDWSWLWLCDAETTGADLAAAARRLGLEPAS